MDIEVKLDAFEGPLDLLLHLIEKNKVDIYDIPIVEITSQYLDYISKMNREDLDSMSSFLVMAATLLDIKSRMLLPVEEDEEEADDPRTDLVNQLLQYKMYKYAAQELKDRWMTAGKRAFRVADFPKEVREYREPVDLDRMTEDHDLAELHRIFLSVIRRQNDKIDPIRSGFGKIEREELSVEDRTQDLQKFAREHKKFSFRGLLKQQSTKNEIIVTFLAVLEMVKSGEIRVSQERLFDDIQIESSIAAPVGS